MTAKFSVGQPTEADIDRMLRSFKLRLMEAVAHGREIEVELSIGTHAFPKNGFLIERDTGTFTGIIKIAGGTYNTREEGI